MFRKIGKSALCVALAALCLATRLPAEDKLFSEKPVGKVYFEEASPTGTDSSTAATRMQNVNQIMDMLRNMGLGPVPEGDTETTIKLQHSKWTFTYVLSLTEDKEFISVILLLGDSVKGLDSGRLLTLMNINSKVRPAVFSFSEKRGRVELLLTLPNGGTNLRQLRDGIDNLAKLAENTSSVWDVPPPADAKTQSPPAGQTPPTAQSPPANQNQQPPAVAGKPAPPSQPQASPPARQGVSLVGKWSAAKAQNEAFAIALNGDGTFVLVYVKDKKQSKSTGKFIISGNQLTLTTTEGGKFVGGISNLTAKTFDFQPQGTGAAKLTFQRAS
jgi:hypothetical protein